MVFGCGIFNELLKLARFRLTSFLNFAINSILSSLRRYITGLDWLGVAISKLVKLSFAMAFLVSTDKCMLLELNSKGHRYTLSYFSLMFFQESSIKRQIDQLYTDFYLILFLYINRVLIAFYTVQLMNKSERFLKHRITILLYIFSFVK